MVYLQSLEGKAAVKATSGAVKLKSIKGGKLDVESTTGNIEASSILGDVNITTTKVRAWAQRPIPCTVCHGKTANLLTFASNKRMPYARVARFGHFLG